MEPVKSICSIEPSGGDYREHFRLGRFTWGPPSVSVSPEGSRIACVKWKGDNRHLCVCSLQSGEGTVYPLSCYSYSWLDDGAICYSLASGLKILDVTTGQTSLF